MPNRFRAKDTVNLAITMAGLSRVHDRYIAGMKYRLVLGDDLEKDFKWLSELERILIGSGYMTKDEIHKRHLAVDSKWRPEHDDPDSNFKH